MCTPNLWQVNSVSFWLFIRCQHVYLQLGKMKTKKKTLFAYYARNKSERGMNKIMKMRRECLNFSEFNFCFSIHNTIHFCGLMLHSRCRLLAYIWLSRIVYNPLETCAQSSLMDDCIRETRPYTSSNQRQNIFRSSLTEKTIRVSSSSSESRSTI